MVYEVISGIKNLYTEEAPLNFGAKVKCECVYLSLELTKISNYWWGFLKSLVIAEMDTFCDWNKIDSGIVNCVSRSVKRS